MAAASQRSDWSKVGTLVDGKISRACSHRPFQLCSDSGSNQFQDAHADQLKPCTWDMNLGESYPLVWRKIEGPRVQSKDSMPCSITDHRYTDETGWEFLTTWTTGPDATATWEPASRFLGIGTRRGCDTFSLILESDSQPYQS